MWSAAVNLFEVVTLVAVALFLLVGVVVTALCPAPLLRLFFGRLRPSSWLSALTTRVALWAEVCATRGHITAATPPALSLGLGLLRRSGFCCSFTLLYRERARMERTVNRRRRRTHEKNKTWRTVRSYEGMAGTYQRRGRAICDLVKSCTLLFYVALITVALQHHLANCTTPRPTTSWGILEACLQTMPTLGRGRRRSQVWKKQWPT